MEISFPWHSIQISLAQPLPALFFFAQQNKYQRDMSVRGRSREGCLQKRSSLCFREAANKIIKTKVFAPINKTLMWKGNNPFARINAMQVSAELKFF